MSEDKRVTYASSGVDYKGLDAFKRAAQRAALQTAGEIEKFSNGRYKDVPWSRGESVHLIETPISFIGHVNEGLGTKNLVADAMQKLTGRCFYKPVAQDTVAMIVNDMITLGVLPQDVAMHLGVGNTDWFQDETRSEQFILGWKEACLMARCSWGCGETPGLKGIILPEVAMISGSAVGVIDPKSRLINPANIQDGDEIVIIRSSGIHANGLTMARDIAYRLPDSYQTFLRDGCTFGEALLEPTHIYVDLIMECLHARIPISYAVNITGHGLRKIMRAPQPFHYDLRSLPEPQDEFRLIQETGKTTNREMYSTFNMGSGYAIFVPNRKEVDHAISIADSLNYEAVWAGTISSASKKSLVLPGNLVFSEDDLDLR